MQILTFAVKLQLMEKAQAWADELAANNKFEHTSVKNLNGECLGENIAMMSGGEAGAADATRMWYCEVDDYYGTINKWQNSPAIGHFTQVSASNEPSMIVVENRVGCRSSHN